MVKTLKITLIVMLLFCANSSVFAQFGIGGGLSGLYGFGSPKSFGGLNVVLELPQDDEMTYFGKITYLFPRQDEITYSEYLNNNNSLLSGQSFDYNFSMDYLLLEGGKRFYIGDGYESGLAGYGSTNVVLILNTVKKNFDYKEFNASDYNIETVSPERGSIFSLGLGLNFGGKYTVPSLNGAFYADLGLNYLLLQPMISNATANGGAPFFKSLFFTFNVGFRKNLY
jgi:hypothetical protein